MELEQLSSKINNMESDIQDIKEHLYNSDIDKAQLKEKFTSLETQFIDVKQDIVNTINKHNEQIWKLVQTGVKVICVLVGVICTISGVKALPDIISFLGGK